MDRKDYYDEMAKMMEQFGRSSEEITEMIEDFKRRDEQAKKYISSRIGILENLIPQYEKCLNEATREEDVQQFLTQNPALCLEAFDDGSMAIDIVPKFKLGQDYITDFTLLGMRSFNTMYHVVMVEIESPLDNPYTKSGTYSQHLNKAIQQVQSWSVWLNRKFETFCADFPEKLNEKIPGLREELRKAMYTYKIVIGRHNNYINEDRDMRGAFFLATNGNIEIMSFDRILEKAKYVVQQDKNQLKILQK